LGCREKWVTAISLFLRSRTKVKSVIDLTAGKFRVLEKDIVDCPASCIIESLYTETIISARWLVGVFGVGTLIDDSIEK
jgi:hypothetical protein